MLLINNRVLQDGRLFIALFLAVSFSGSAETAKHSWPSDSQLPVNLIELFDNDAIAQPPRIRDGNFDCPDHPETIPGSAYPGERLPETGSVLTVGENPKISFLFPSKLEGEPNNVACNGQILDLEDGYYSAAYILGASENGDYDGVFEINYWQGPDEKNVGLTDWCAEPRYGEFPAITSPYRYAWQNGGQNKEELTCYLWMQKIPLDPRKKFDTLTLPYQRRMHVFALTLVAAKGSRQIQQAAQDIATLYASLKNKKAIYANAIRQQIQALRKQTAAVRPSDPFFREVHWLNTLLDFADWRLPRGDGRVSGRLARAAFRWLGIVKSNLGDLAQGRNPFPAKRGQILKSYYSELDDSWQTYAVSVPQDYDGTIPYPLVVQLHGHGWYRPFQGLPLPVVWGVIYAAPQGRGSIDYMLSAEQDVLRVIEEVRKDYKIDPSRIILEGHSMGGTGSWHLGGRFPDQFTCIAPVAGNTDHTVFYKDRTLPPEKPGPVKELRDFLRLTNDPITYAPNLRNLPVFCGHGSLDTVVRVGHARNMIRRLQSLQYHPVYHEYPTVRHWGFPKQFYTKRWDWMMKQRRAMRPRHVRYRSAHLRYSGAYWLKIRQFERWGAFADVEGVQVDAGTVRIQTKNVTALSVLTGRLAESPPVRIGIWVNNRKAYDGRTRKVIDLYENGGEWSDRAPDQALSKRPDLEGPVADAFLSPFILVYGTISKESLWNRICRAEAEAFAADWELMYRARPRIKPDTEVTDEDIKRYNLILYGGQNENAVSARLASRLPVRMDGSAVVVGNKRFTGEGIGFRVCFPNPLNPDRYAVLAAGVKPFSLWQINNRFGNWAGWGPFDNWNWFDYAVFDNRTRGPETMLCMGFFGPDWQLDPRSHWRGESEARQEAEPRKTPLLLTENDLAVAGDRVWLSDVVPSRIRQHKGTAVFDRSYQHNPIRISGKTYSRGFGVRAPSSIEFQLYGKFRTLRTAYGIDLEGASSATEERSRAEWVQFRVFGDGRRLWSSEWIQWSWKTEPVEIDITGVQTLKIEVDGGGRRWLFGSSSWGNTQLDKLPIEPE